MPAEAIKISPKTLTILKNFNLINPNIVIYPGNYIRTVRDGLTAFAEAKVDETFPVEFPIYDIADFLSATSLFDEPKYIFGEDNVLIKEAPAKQKYFFSDKNM